MEVDPFDDSVIDHHQERLRRLKRRRMFDFNDDDELFSSIGGVPPDVSNGVPPDVSNGGRRGNWARVPRNGNPEGTGHALWNWPSWASRWNVIIDDPSTRNPRSYMGRSFRAKFRVPRVVFDYLLAETIKSGKFSTPGPCVQGQSNTSHRLELKLLASLRVLAKGCDFELVSEIALISPTTLERFHHAWMEWGVEHLLPKWIQLPQGPKLQHWLECFRRMGLPGRASCLILLCTISHTDQLFHALQVH